MLKSLSTLLLGTEPFLISPTLYPQLVQDQAQSHHETRHFSSLHDDIAKRSHSSARSVEPSQAVEPAGKSEHLGFTQLRQHMRDFQLRRMQLHRRRMHLQKQRLP